MITETKKVFADAALIVATGIVATEFSRGSAQAEYMPAEGTTAYSASRIAVAFDAAAEVPPVTPIGFPVATKGDLPVPLECVGAAADAQAECMDVAYEVPSVPSIVVETRFGNTSTVMRMDALTVAEFAEIFNAEESEFAQ